MLFYFNRLSPPLGALNFLLPRRNPAAIKRAVQKAVGSAGRVTEVSPRPAEGGAFVRVEPAADAADAADAAATDLRAAAQRGFTVRWLLLSHRARGFEVRGHPWITDIPRSLSRVVTVQPALEEEDCYDLLRPYGRIRHVADGRVTFSNVQDAVAASFCAHRASFDGKLVRLRLAPSISWSAKGKEWFRSHPRVMLPLLSLLLLSALYAVFEPVRELSVRMKINNTLGGVHEYVEWARASTQRLSSLGNTLCGFGHISKPSAVEPPSDWNQLDSKGEVLKRYLLEGNASFIAVIGPEGSGKQTVVNTALQNLDSSPPLLEIPCEKLRDADPALLRNLAASLGYRPSLLWLNRVFKLVEVAIKGLTGQNSEFSETSAQQAERMLGTASTALRKLALRNFDPKSADAAAAAGAAAGPGPGPGPGPGGNASSAISSASSNASIAATGTGTATTTSTRADRAFKEQLYLEANPNERPVVVLHNFNSTEHTCDQLARWAAALIHSNVARVVCVSQDTAFDKLLSQALPNRVLQTIRAEDAAPHAAYEYIMSMLDRERQSSPKAQAAISQFAKLSNDFLEPLGGRFSDLQSFGRRLLNGEPPQMAMDSIVRSASVEVLQLYLTETREWSLEQAWRIVLLLAQRSGAAGSTWNLIGNNNSNTSTSTTSTANGMWLSVPGNVISQPEFSGFSGPKQQSEIDEVLHAMDSAGMLSLHSVGGHVSGIKPARPIFRAAFYELLRNPVVCNYMDMRLAKSAIARETAKIKAFEEELVPLVEIGEKYGKDPVKSRIQYVSEQMKASQQRIVESAHAQAAAQASLKELKWVEETD